MEELVNTKKDMTASGQVDHADQVTELDNTYKDLLKQAKKSCAMLDGALKTRKQYNDSLKELEDCLETCANEIPVLEQPGMPIEDKLKKCEVR